MGLRKLAGQKTYWHLLGSRRRPSTYDIASSKLLYYPTLGFGVDTPVGAWYARHQADSLFTAASLSGFSDPRQTTYAGYTQLQSEAEAYLSGVLDAASAASTAVDPFWLQTLGRVFAPLRYPCHALMMLAAYVGSMAPESKVAIAAALQSADEIRRVNALARRLHQLRGALFGLGEDAREVWTSDPLWQPLRAGLERALVTWDWSRCFVLLNLVIKPAFDDVFNRALARRARESGDATTAQVLAALEADGRWQRDWSRALLRAVFAATPDARATVLQWIAEMAPPIDAALAPLGDLIGDASGEDHARAATGARDAFLATCGFDTKSPATAT